MAKKSEITRYKILSEAFKLFCTKQYDNVTFMQIQHATNLSRGALMYHFTDKEDIFRTVVNEFLLEHQSITQAISGKDLSLIDFIDSFIAWIEESKIAFEQLQISNMNYAMVTITHSAINFYTGFKDKAAEWNSNEVQTWETHISKAVKNNEVKKDIDQKAFANMFKNIYYGTSYSGLINPNGINVEMLKREFYVLYNTIKL